MLYFTRCTNDGFQVALSFRGALRTLRIMGPDAAVYTITRKWVAGRRVEAAPASRA